MIIPYAIFRRIFKRLETGSIKLFFDFVFKLNNGEDKKSNPGKDKPVFFTAFTTKYDTIADRKKHNHTFKWLKKRCKSEVLNLLFGGEENLALEQFFIFNKKDLRKGKVQVFIRPEYYVSKAAVGKFEKVYDPLERYKKKAGIIQEFVSTYCTFKYSVDDIRDFVGVLKKESRRVIELLIGTLEVDAKTRRQKNWRGIGSLGAYLRWLHENYKNGDRALVYGKSTEQALYRLKDDFAF